MIVTVATKNTVNLTTYTSNRLIAATYNVAVTATLSGYPYGTLSTAALNPTLNVVDPCTLTTISSPTIPPISQFVGFTKVAGPFHFVDTV
jgi:hypothetical protein